MCGNFIMAIYDRQSLIDLKDRTEDESWLLEAAYEIVENSLFPEWPDQLIYPPVGGDPQLIAYGRGNIVIGDWRPHFLKAGAPLLFVTTFKIIDMLVEWVLEQNGQRSTYRFQQKIAALKAVQSLPPFVSARPWLWSDLRGWTNTSNLSEERWCMPVSSRQWMVTLTSPNLSAVGRSDDHRHPEGDPNPCCVRHIASAISGGHVANGLIP